MSDKRMLADVLWDAANEHLRSDEHDFGKSSYTCDCLFAAGGERGRNAAMRFLQRLGLPRGSLGRSDLFDAFERGEKRQGVRYMWLLLAMHVAEDEGITV